MKLKEYIQAAYATRNKNTLNRIIYYSGYDPELNESDVKAVIAAADARIVELNREKAIERMRRNNRSIAKIQA